MILFLSIVSWFAVGVLISSIMLVDYNWFNVSAADTTSSVYVDSNLLSQLFQTLLASDTFWLALLMLVMMVFLKDLAFAGFMRTSFYTNEQIVQEVTN